MWVGDLVTTAWWDDIWVNEGFASWITGKIRGRWHPEWKTRSTSAAGMSAVMGADTLVSACRVRQPIDRPGDIANTFDGITYSKGAAILGMSKTGSGGTHSRRASGVTFRATPGRAVTTAELTAAPGAASGRDVAAVLASA